MAFPSGKTQRTLNQAFADTRAKARSIKQLAVDLKAKSLAGTLTRKEVMEFATSIADALDVWNNSRAITGIGQYAKDQVADQTLNVALEFSSMLTSVAAARNWIITNFPNTAGHLLERKFDANGRMVLSLFTTAQVDFRVELDKIITAIAD